MATFFVTYSHDGQEQTVRVEAADEGQARCQVAQRGGPAGTGLNFHYDRILRISPAAPAFGPAALRQLS